MLLILTAIGSIAFGWLTDKIGPKRLLMFSLLLIVVAAVNGLWVHTPLQIAFVLGLAGLGVGAQNASAYPLLTRIVPAKEIGFYVGLQTAAASLAGPGAVWLTGALINHSGYRVIFGVCALCLLLAFVVLSLLREQEAGGEIAARQAEEAVGRLRRGEDLETRRIEELTAQMPVWLLRLTMTLQDFAHYTLNVSLRSFGIPDDRFGSAIISNFGVLGLDNALVPLSPYCRCPLIVGIGRPRPKPIVRDSEVVAAECITISFTFDHRYADGVHGGLMMRRFQKIFLKPSRYAAIFEAKEPSGDNAPGTG